jgi:hypothetical protein
MPYRAPWVLAEKMLKLKAPGPLACDEFGGRFHRAAKRVSAR